MKPESLLVGLDPFIVPKTKFLILGSFPSVKSLEYGFYYSHPRNRFFPTLAKVFQEKVPITIEERKELLVHHGISLFDVIKSCTREGSLDSKIKNIIVNDFSLYLSQQIKIGCTGKTSYNLFKKYYPGAEVTYLPSTSPANQVSFSIEPYYHFFDR